MNAWKWSNRGVDLESDRLLWYEELGATAFASGAGCPQTFEDFLRHGPAVEGVPPEIVSEVGQAVRARVQEQREPTADPGDGPDFDHLSRTANAADAGMAEKSALYAAAFQLENWLFIARGQLPEVQPYVAANQSIADGAPMVKAFTDSRRLHAFASANGLTDPDGGVQILALPVAGILPTMASIASQGVTHIHFNADQASDGFYAPLGQLPPIRQYLVSNGYL